jgi:D-alanyl-D-alanine endopeptidase (penicillin-binding protein 7)
MHRSLASFSRFFGIAPLAILLTAAALTVSVPAAAAAKKAPAKSVAKKADKPAKSTAAAKTSRGKMVAARASRSGGKAVAAAKTDRADRVAVKKVVMVKGKRRVVTTYAARAVPMRAAFVPPSRPSLGEALGLRSTEDALDLRSSVALVMDQNTHEVLFQKNPSAVLPIASITKLMTALVVMDAAQPMGETLEVSEDDRDLEKGTGSRLAFGTRLTREEFMLLALMSSENRAASVLGRYYPGGRPAFVQAMNRKAREIGMNDSRFVDSNGLSSSNVSSASDLAKLVATAYRHPTIRQFTTQPDHDVTLQNGRLLRYVNTNRLVRGGEWDIGLQKTGFINEAGRCLVMQAKVHGRDVIMVFLDSAGKLSRFADAVRVRDWLEHSTPVAPSNPNLTRTPATPSASVLASQSSGA